jgi:uncharacterized protein (TIGR02265 family)
MFADDHRVRGIMFTSLLNLAREAVGPEGEARVRGTLGSVRELALYSARDYLFLIERTARELEPAEGYEVGMQRCGSASVLAFAATAAGGIFFKVVGMAGIAALMSRAGSAYRSMVTFGARTFESTGPTQGVFRVRGDPTPAAFHVGVLTTGIAYAGNDSVVEAHPLARGDVDYAIAWQPKK